MKQILLLVNLPVFLVFHLVTGEDNGQVLCGFPTTPSLLTSDVGAERNDTELGPICLSKLPSAEAFLLCCIKNRFRSEKNVLSFRPTFDYNQPVKISPEILITGLREINDQLRIVTIDAKVSLSWINNFIDWSNSAQTLIKDIAKISADAAKLGPLWVPRILHSNAAGNLYKLNDIARKVEVILKNRPGGAEISWRIEATLSANCELSDLDSFPFDLQQCSFDFISEHVPSLVEMKNVTLQSDFPMRPHPIWEVTNLYSTDYHFDVVKHRQIFRLHFNLKRNFNYWFTFIIAPFFLLGLLQISSFCLPVYRTKRARFCAIITLTFVALQLAVRQAIPVTSYQITLIFYIFIQFTIGIFSTLFAIFMFRIYGKIKTSAIPEYLEPRRAKVRNRMVNPDTVNSIGLIFIAIVTLASHFLLFSSSTAAF